jgi:hypothetical protein
MTIGSIFGGLNFNSTTFESFPFPAIVLMTSMSRAIFYDLAEPPVFKIDWLRLPATIFEFLLVIAIKL